MPSVNRVTLIGHLGHDPELLHTPKGTAVLNLRMATSMRWKDRDTDQTNERTEWHRVVLFGKRAEAIGAHGKKGAQIYVEGSLQTREWTDRDGVKRYVTEILGKTVLLLGKKSEVAAQPAADAVPASETEEPEDIPF